MRGMPMDNEEHMRLEEMLNRLNLFEAVIFGLYGGWLISLVDKISFSDRIVGFFFTVLGTPSWVYQGSCLGLSFVTLLLLFGFSMFKPNFMTRRMAFVLGFGHIAGNYAVLWAEGLTSRLVIFWAIGTCLFFIIYAIELRRVRIVRGH